MTFITEQHDCCPISVPICVADNLTPNDTTNANSNFFIDDDPSFDAHNKNDDTDSHYQHLEYDQLSVAVDSLLHGASPYDFPPDILASALPVIKNAKLQCVKDKNYIEANKIKIVQKDVSHAITVTNFSQQCNEQVQSLLIKRQRAQDDLDVIANEWERRYSDLESQIEAKKRKLIFEQAQEMQRFDINAESQLQNVTYRPNPDTLLLRKKEDGLVANEDYLRAEKVKKKAERLESMQTEVLKSRAIDELEKNRKTLLERQNAQTEVLNQWADERRRDFEKAREIEVNAAAKRVLNYDKDLGRITKKGIAPNPNLGFTSKNVSRKDGLKAVRNAALCKPKMTAPVKRKRLAVMCYRPSTSVCQQYRKSNAHTSYPKKLDVY